MTQGQKTEKKARRSIGCLGCLGRLFIAGLLLALVVIFGGILLTMTLITSNLSTELDDGIARLATARERETFQTTQILDRNGELLWEIFGEGKRTTVALEQIPLEVRYATISVEDDSFYQNKGFDEPSLVAALIANLGNLEDPAYGASTITQQLVRHIAFEYEERVSVSYRRKLKEVMLAWVMTRNFTKDEILAMYLNEIYYGNLAYGIEAAAQTYFGKSAEALNLPEAAFLAGLPQSPVELDPYTNLEGAKDRQWIVLSLMVQEGYIDKDAADQAYLAPLTFAEQRVSLTAPHFAIYARQQAEAQLGADVVANGGLRIITTLDLRYQRLAEQLARQRLAQLAGNNVTNAALVALKPGTGEILALLGSADYDNAAIDGQVNIALTPQQPGSTMKPLTYALALTPEAATGEPLWTAADVAWDVPVAYEQLDGQTYAPVNYDGRFHGPVRLRDALANSYNVPAILVMQDVGVPALLDFAGRLGITSLGQDASRYGLALTLGAGEITPLEMTTAFGVFANEGRRVTPRAILEIRDADGAIVFQPEGPSADTVVDPRVAFLISDILADDEARVPAMGAGSVLDLPFPAAVKTGTTNDFRDNWTIGYTPGLVVGVWTGNSDNSEMEGVSGLTGAAPLWSDFMQAVAADPALRAVQAVDGVAPAAEFAAPAGMVRRPICRLASVVEGADACAPAGEEWFLETTAVAAAEATATSTVDPAIAVPVVWQDIDPAVVAAPGLPVEAAAPIDAAAAPTPDPDAPPPPRFCVFAEGSDAELLPPEAFPGVWLQPPRNLESIRGAYEWAYERGLAILPPDVCTAEDVVVRDPNTVAVFRITTPKDGDVLSENVALVGTADWDPGQAQFYKIEITRAATPDRWVTLGEVGREPVVNGVLEFLNVEALLNSPDWGPGEYIVRLLVVRNDGNYAGAPFEVRVMLEP